VRTGVKVHFYDRCCKTVGSILGEMSLTYFCSMFRCENIAMFGPMMDFCVSWPNWITSWGERGGFSRNRGLEDSWNKSLEDSSRNRSLEDSPRNKNLEDSSRNRSLKDSFMNRNLGDSFGYSILENSHWGRSFDDISQDMSLENSTGNT
jgi:hypothetical protein